VLSVQRCKHTQHQESAIKHPALSLISAPPHPAVGTLPCADEPIRAALKAIVGSRQFAKAYRCATLLTYLIERALNRDDHSPPPEQEIGIAVFGRDRLSYHPGDDPIVRVQAGRLRLRLAAYYADEGAAAPLRITVPLGSYQARIAFAEGQPARADGGAPVLVLHPLVCLGAESSAASFTAGLNDELAYRLYRELSSFRLVGPAMLASEAGTRRAIHLLEGTVRQDASRLRVSLHLRHSEEGTVLWYEQFDSVGDGSIAGQEQMAERCVRALQRHMPAAGAVTAPP
jgi:TolB-like protein